MEQSLLPNEISAEILYEIGITAFGTISSADITFLDEVRHICEGNVCGNYGKTWACPPGIGTLTECRTRVLQYESALVFATTFPLEDSFDFEGMREGHRKFKNICDALYDRLNGSFLLLSNEGCTRCEECTYPDSPCRFPHKLFGALEGYGILVTELAKAAGIKYYCGENTVTYFGAVCF